jgi:uncharacterized radical SAM protein YgiQ
MFLPTTKDEMQALGWNRLDIILLTGDSYIDSPFIGVAVIGKVLLDAGFRVGIIAQPDTDSESDIRRLGEPALFWGVTGGCVDSMVANYTATGRRRKKDDYTPGGLNTRRPDRAVIVYSNLIRRVFKPPRPIVLGGIEASLRRVAHYDVWANKIRRAILFDARADYLLYGMAERSVVELARALKTGNAPETLRGLCYISKTAPDDCLMLPAFEEVVKDKAAFTRMFNTFYQNNDPVTALPLAQKQDTRFLVQNPPAYYLSQRELDTVYNLAYERDLHPYYRKQGSVKALETIRFSLTTHRGCYGGCSFCTIAVHQGRRVRWRSAASILTEAKQIARHPKFRGVLHDVGGPTANMYGFECARKETSGPCREKQCLFPEVCPELRVDHTPQIKLLKALRHIPGIKKVVVASGIRHDLVLADTRHGPDYLREVVRHHVSGQMKIAPEHTEPHILNLMQKPGVGLLLSFVRLFYRLTREAGKKQFLTYYLIAAHPGCSAQDMGRLRAFFLKNLHTLPEQIQIFTPTPSTWSTLIYWTEKDPFTGGALFVEKTVSGKEKQKALFLHRRGTRRRQGFD